MNVYIMNINQLDYGIQEAVAHYIDKPRMERAEQFKFDADRKRSLCAGYLLNYGLRECFPEIEIPVMPTTDKLNGKPYLPQYPHIHFNLSHAGEYAVCAIDDVPIGIDIEQCKKDGEKIAKRFFTKEEYQDIYSVTDDAKRKHRFCQYWVLKESFMKATGYGMKLSMSDFSVCMGEPITYRHLINEQSYYAKIYDIDKDYCMAVCSTKNDKFGDLTIL